MTKAFDTNNREHLYILLSDILDPDELSIMNILLKDLTLQVKNNKTKGQTLTINLRIPQRNCLSAILSSIYLSNTLPAKIPTHLYDHNYHIAHSIFPTPIEHLHDHNYCIKQDNNNITDYIIDHQYSDDIGLISNSKSIIDTLKKNIASILREKNFTMDEKTMQHTFNRTKKKTGRSVSTLEHF